ncbi:MAG: 4-hydroxythreonine-4-phosphate dehydrogenase PdxA [Calditrichales bacterium]|nr:4-hydroxythreonine-4-phosphate dehydrogenase PdxA [Calditrichales bacterium]
MMLPKIGITLGDPAGIGSEITAKLITFEKITDICIPVIIGDAKLVQQGLDIISSTVNFKVISSLDGKLEKNVIYVYDLNNIKLSDFHFGKISSKAGRASGEFIETAISAAKNKAIDAIVTNPIHKESFTLGGFGDKYAGHTEMLADLTNTKSYCMMLANANLRVCHVTTHVSLLQALTTYITTERILEVINLANDTCLRLGIAKPRIGVAAINPHAGEHGKFGDEEERLIIPAIKQAAKIGIITEGPVSADILFSKAKSGLYDIVVTMYHDQGHIPVKLSGFVFNNETNKWDMRGVNVTLGLPIIRTSVDHGTAFGKAGKGNADHKSLFDALRFAIDLV